MVLLLSKMHLIMEELMEGSEIDRILLSTYRHQISFRMDRKVGVISLVGKEWSDPCGGIWSVVICKLSQGQKV